jgi:hypothetical protein
MRSPSVPVLLLAGTLLSSPLSADDVYLTNGRSFKGVIAEVGETQVKIHMPGGELGIPKSQVARIEAGDSAYAEYLRRRGEVRLAADRAGAWLDLARWAKANGLGQAAREAALAAADLDPRREGLITILRGEGYAYDEQLDRWIPYADAMRRQGMVLSSGEWITREEHAARELERQEAAERRAAAEADRTARARSEAVLRLAEIQLYKETLRATQPEPEPYGPQYWWPGYLYVPPVVHPPHHPRPPHGPGPKPDHGLPPGSPNLPRKGYGGLLERQPGSLLPVNPPRSSSSSRQ